MSLLKAEVFRSGCLNVRILAKMILANCREAAGCFLLPQFGKAEDEALIMEMPWVFIWSA